ncbi:thermonuclease family protein [Azospirillum halopraeferens]|uniref:thermonuclease family protein n=1 Tax=Azospirillum halopraeferens TaxID=34010 RepID=UPI0004151977|nr:thermonuclease family protein [Azospirillum halopraeferens]
MRAVLTVPLLLALLAAAPAAGREPPLPGPIAADVLEVVDGDTLAVRATIWLGQRVETRVRIDGIDTPELRGRCAEEKRLAQSARTLLGQLVDGRPVQLLQIRNDKFGGRVRARVVTAAGTDVASALIDAGLARPYAGEQRRPWCEGA